MKKITTALLLMSTIHIFSISSTMSHRTVSTSPLLYAKFDNNTEPKLLINESHSEISFDIAPYFSSMYNPIHTIGNLTPEGKATLLLNQQGGGDINPTWLNLMSNNTLANYTSQVTFTPSSQIAGFLLQYCQEFKHGFIDIRSALLACSTKISITEVGGGNGINPGIINAEQAFTQSGWDYGKIGQSNQVFGLDNIQCEVGGYTKISDDTNSNETYFLGSLLIEAPTGTGTKAEWLFEPQVGTNHWGIGFRTDFMICSQNDIKLLFGLDYRFFTPAWENRSFDLTENGQWSRYLSIQDMYGLPTAPATLGLPGINFLTQQAKINCRNQVNLYARIQKQLRHCAFELSYNYFYSQAETISAINEVTPGYGIYSLTGPAGGSGGVTTSSLATINQVTTAQDPINSPVAITSAMFNKSSAQADAFSSNTFVAQIRRTAENYNYGIGANVEVALSAGAISSWGIWAKFEYIFSHAKYDSDDFDISMISETLDASLLSQDKQETKSVQTSKQEAPKVIAPEMTEAPTNPETTETILDDTNHDMKAFYNDLSDEELNEMCDMLFDEAIDEYLQEQFSNIIDDDSDIIIVDEQGQDTLETFDELDKEEDPFIISENQSDEELNEMCDMLFDEALDEYLQEQFSNIIDEQIENTLQILDELDKKNDQFIINNNQDILDMVDAIEEMNDDESDASYEVDIILESPEQDPLDTQSSSDQFISNEESIAILVNDDNSIDFLDNPIDNEIIIEALHNNVIDNDIADLFMPYQLLDDEHEVENRKIILGDKDDYEIID